MKNVAMIAEEAARKKVEELGFELADVEYVREQGQMCLNLYICAENGVTIDNCESVSREVDGLIDDADPTDGKPYCLCVSTWGDRELKRDRDFERNMGKEVEVRLRVCEKGKKKRYVGKLEGFDDVNIKIATDAEIKSFVREQIACVRPYIGF